VCEYGNNYFGLSFITASGFAANEFQRRSLIPSSDGLCNRLSGFSPTTKNLSNASYLAFRPRRGISIHHALTFYFWQP